MNEVFLDTGFIIALVIEQDQYHRHALAVAAEIERTTPRVVTTELVLVEIANTFAAPLYRPKAISHIEELRQSPDAEVIRLSEDLMERGFALYKNRQDKSWGLTDCVSFVIMRERGLRDALTTDSDFEQAGFNALLRE